MKNLKIMFNYIENYFKKLQYKFNYDKISIKNNNNKFKIIILINLLQELGK